MEQKGYVFIRRIDRSRVFNKKDVELISEIASVLLNKRTSENKAIEMCIQDYIDPKINNLQEKIVR